MAKINTPVKYPAPRTGGGAIAARISTTKELRRTVLACMLWEDAFYEDGESIADRIKALVANLADRGKAQEVADVALEARSSMNLRHVPLLLVRELARHGALRADWLARVIQRADELTEFLAIYWKDGKQPLSKQVKLGLAQAFGKFNEYALAKYNRDGAVKLRDVLFLTHPKPRDEAQAALWKRLAEGTLAIPDTWEVTLSSGANKTEAWPRLLREGRLGALALLRNLRNMTQAKVDAKLVADALATADVRRVLPFRFVAAAKAAPEFEPAIDAAFLRGLAEQPKLPGKTVVIVDVSGSMYHGAVSRKSDMSRAHAACALAAICREVCEQPVIYATAGSDARRIHDTRLVPARRGMALVDAIYDMCRPLGGGGIFLTQVMDFVASREENVDRVIVITDEQDCDTNPGGEPARAKMVSPRNYMLNVSSEKNGIGYGEKWTHITGFSEACIRYITASETQQQ